ncbi:armadillo repeat-containing protein 10 isoform X1 [Dromiciops gliroides]|uniref:armadillo repeat-containing protein 10 isoform X1 n=1 Tax=Dromiciops gliroides TaxID=33562 RepID=UPI001CC64DE5|nr:armadillo repeat-containing protein 10 isoform X1 [Dromiciops gliroides]
MGRAQEAGWLAGLVLGAGACYCVYRLAWGKEKSRKTAAAGGSRGCPAGPGQTLLQRASGLPVVASPSPPAEDDFAKSSSILEAQHLKKLICLLESTEDPLIREKALITLGNSAAFSINQDIIHNLDGLLVIGNILKDPNPKIKEKALNALNNLSMNIQNQREIKVYMSQICKETISSPLNSNVQLAGLRLLTNMTVTNDYQHLIAHSVSDFFDLLCVGNETTKIQTLKVLLNLSANPAMTSELLSVQVPSSLISLFEGNVEKEILTRVLMLFANLNDNVKQKENAFAQHQFNNGSLFSLLYGESTECTEKLLSLAYHHDVDVKEKVAKILTVL